MKNLARYFDDYDEDYDVMESSTSKKLKNAGRNIVGDTEEYIKANRKASREEEIKAHGHPINHKQVWKSKKDYTRKQKHIKDYE